jgi:CubicO group peptidase (beta-lactamase class C family)
VARALDAIRGWPAAHAAAAVVLADGSTADREGPDDLPFALASVTKLLTAAAALVAVEERAVNLDEPAGPPGSTVRHLLAHASGLAPDDPSVLAPPGTRRIYSNHGFEVLASHVAGTTAVPFETYVDEGVLMPLGMAATRLAGSPASGAVAPLADLIRLASELVRPQILAAETLALAATVAFPGLAGVLPGFGPQRPNDWGLGLEIRGSKSPHWTGTANSPRAFGHFGRTGAFMWIDPDAGVALACLTDLEFGPWAAAAWPALSDAVLAEWVK